MLKFLIGLCFLIGIYNLYLYSQTGLNLNLFVGIGVTTYSIVNFKDFWTK